MTPGGKAPIPILGGDARFFELSLDLLCLASHDGYFLRVNPAFVSTLGWTEEQMLAQRFVDFVHPEDVPGTLAEMVSLAAGALTIDFANRYRCANGEWRWLNWRARPDVESGLIYAVAHDVTALRAARERAERAREAAERANAAKSSFLTNMSHELRTPLNAVIGYSELLQEEFAAAGRLEGRQLQQAIIDLDRIRSAGRQLLGMVNGVLDLARVDAGRMPVCFESVHVPSLLAEVGNVMLPAMQSNQNELRTELSPGLDVMVTDGTLLRQVLLNLLANGARFTHGGVVVLAAEALDAEHVRFSVTDSGIGLDPDDVPRLLQPFVQGDGSSTRRYGGTGLGLSICHRFAGLLGGTLQGTGERGRGARFWVDLPRSVPEAVHTPSGPQTPETVDLLVLAPPEVARWALHIAEELKLSVVAADTVMQALALARKYRPRVVVLDPIAPDAASWGAAAELCSGGPRPSALVLAHEEGGSSVALGFAAHFGKPVAPGALGALLRRSDVRAGIPSAVMLAPQVDDRALLGSILTHEGWRAHCHTTVAELEAAFGGIAPDLLLVDLSAAGSGALDLVKRLADDPRFATLPICAVQDRATPVLEFGRLSAELLSLSTLGQPLDVALRHAFRSVGFGPPVAG